MYPVNVARRRARGGRRAQTRRRTWEGGAGEGPGDDGGGEEWSLVPGGPRTLRARLDGDGMAALNGSMPPVLASQELGKLRYFRGRGGPHFASAPLYAPTKTRQTATTPTPPIGYNVH